MPTIPEAPHKGVRTRRARTTPLPGVRARNPGNTPQREAARLQSEIAFYERKDHIVIEEDASYTLRQFASRGGERGICDHHASIATVEPHARMSLLHSGVTDGRGGVTLGLDRPFHGVLRDNQVDALITGYLSGRDFIPPLFKNQHQESLEWHALQDFPIYRTQTVHPAVKFLKNRMIFLMCEIICVARRRAFRLSYLLFVLKRAKIQLPSADLCDE